MVIGVEGAENRVGLIGSFGKPYGVFGKLLVAGPNLEDIIPRIGPGECDLAWGYAKNWTVVAMKLLNVVDECASEEGEDEGET